QVEAQLHGARHLVHVLPARPAGAQEALLDFARVDRDAAGDADHRGSSAAGRAGRRRLPVSAWPARVSTTSAPPSSARSPGYSASTSHTHSGPSTVSSSISSPTSAAGR